MDHGTSRRWVVPAALAAAALAVLATVMPAGAHPNVPRWYQYDKVTWQKTWRSKPVLVTDHDRWHNDHPNDTTEQNEDYHLVLRSRWRHMHFHRALSRRDGKVTWYDGTGKVGACGVRLYGLYAASRTLPCGALVSIRHDGRYVFVRVLDRGPWGDYSRIFDLSPRAFEALAPLPSGVIQARTIHVTKR
jgi:rare lipoprotein A (peptidoglycan hydrolase)